MNNVDHYLMLVMRSEFPYDNISDAAIRKDYIALRASDKPTSNAGLKIVRNFHRSIWRCNKHGYKSPLDAWQDEKIMQKVIKNRLKYLNGPLSIYNIRSGLSIARLAPKVSVFRPATAKYLINKYLSDYVEVFDPCSGFSGRMLGACALGKRYIGQDINSITIKESELLRDSLKLNATLRIADSIYDEGEYSCLFTCPPYGDKENWHQEIETLSADEWITICMQNYHCAAYLFVVDKTTLYKNFIVEELGGESYIGGKKEFVILIKPEK